MERTFCKRISKPGVETMEKQLIEKVIDEAKTEEANLVIWDRRDTFTVESEDVGEIEINDDHLRIPMQDGKAVVYVEYDYVYKLVVEKERSARAGVRAGFAASS
jgi:sporulation-control protein spo0M